jgi:hypothetical protein
VSTGSKPLLSLIVVVRNTKYGVAGIDMKTLETLVFSRFLDFKNINANSHHLSVKASKGLEADKAKEAALWPESEGHC